jgi:hypothetical protein
MEQAAKKGFSGFVRSLEPGAEKIGRGRFTSLKR